MVQLKTKLKVVDNSGARLVSCVKIMGSSVRNNNVKIGSVLVVSVLRCKPRSIRVKKGSLRLAILIHSRQVLFRKTSFCTIRFGLNVVILINRNLAPLAKRFRAPLTQEFCYKFPFLGSICKVTY